MISLILLNWNGKDVLERAIKSVLNQTYNDYEIIVVDNNSKDGSQEMLKKYDVKLIQLNENKGVVEPRNIGMREANGELLFILDNDAELKKDAFEKAIEKFKEDSKLGILSCSLIDKNNVTSVWMHKISKKYADKEFLTTIYSGGAHVIRKEILDKTGYYPNYFFITTEELDLSLRVLDNGYEIKYFPDVVVYHRQRKNNDVSEVSKYYGMRNMYLVYWRLFPFNYALFRTLKKFGRDLNFKPFYGALKLIPKVMLERHPIKKSTLNLIKKIENESFIHN